MCKTAWWQKLIIISTLLKLVRLSRFTKDGSFFYCFTGTRSVTILRKCRKLEETQSGYRSCMMTTEMKADFDDSISLTIARTMLFFPSSDYRCHYSFWVRDQFVWLLFWCAVLITTVSYCASSVVSNGLVWFGMVINKAVHILYFIEPFWVKPCLCASVNRV